MASLKINPTRMEMTRLKKRLLTARRGHKLLKDKRDEMVRRFISLVKENRSLRLLVEERLTRALRGFALARAVMNPMAMDEALLYPARQLSVQANENNILSVRVPTFTIKEDSLQQSTLSYGFADTAGELDSAIAGLAELFPDMIRLAELEKTCSMLSDEIEKTRRRVNALEYVLIPSMEDGIRFIAMKLDENERGALTRLMKVKEMIEKRKEAF